MENVAGHAYSPLMLYPFATAAAVETILKVDPGAYWPWTSRFMTGSPEPVPNR